MKNLVAISALMLLVGCADDPWNEDEKNEFMKACMEETAKEQYCRCYMENVMEKYPQAEDSRKMSFEEGFEFSKDCK